MNISIQKKNENFLINDEHTLQQRFVNKLQIEVNKPIAIANKLYIHKKYDHLVTFNRSKSNKKKWL